MLQLYDLEFWGNGWGCVFQLASKEIWEQTELEYTIAEALARSGIDVENNDPSFPAKFEAVAQEEGFELVRCSVVRAMISFHEILDFRRDESQKQ